MKKLSILLFVFLYANIAMSQSADDLVKSGIEKAKTSDFKQAIMDFTQALQKDPKNINALL